MEEEEIEKAVIAYLKKKGFKQTELAFQEEQQQQHTKTSSSTDPDIAKHILSFSEYVSLSHNHNCNPNSLFLYADSLRFSFSSILSSNLLSILKLVKEDFTPNQGSDKFFTNFDERTF